MYSVISHDGDKMYGVNEYVCDSLDDLVILPRCAAAKVAEIVANADADFDTLKEIADWILADR